MFPGRTIADRYRVVRVLGRGGMGVVSEVEQIDDGEHFAIKFLREDVESDMQPNARFLREAKLATKLKSAHTCRIITVGEWELGPYIVMELLEGRSLNVLLERGRKLAWPQAARIAYEMCDALAEAHHLGIVHRDVKPGNVYLATTAARQAITKVLDFGVAKIPNSVVTKHGEHSLTDASTLLGTPSYVAPEQLINSKLVDARADVWAVGVMLYEMLAGQLPFSSPLVPKLLVMIAKDEPPALASLVSDIPDGLVQVVHRCLLKDPSLRFADAGALAQALTPWLDGAEDLLLPLLRAASLRPSLRPSNPPLPEPTQCESSHHRHSDSLDPHTTANFGKLNRNSLARMRYAAAGAVLGIIGAGVQFMRQAKSESASEPGIVIAAQPNAAAKPRVIQLTADPAKARIALDGTTLGSNPARLVWADDGRPHELLVSAPGFVSERRTLRFDVDQQISVSLRPNLDTPAVPSVVAHRKKPPSAAARPTAGSSTAPKEISTRQLDQHNPF